MKLTLTILILLLSFGASSQDNDLDLFFVLDSFKTENGIESTIDTDSPHQFQYYKNFVMLTFKLEDKQIYITGRVNDLVFEGDPSGSKQLHFWLKNLRNTYKSEFVFDISEDKDGIVQMRCETKEKNTPNSLTLLFSAHKATGEEIEEIKKQN